MNQTQELLRNYVANGSEEAFRELVLSYVDLVYSTALRLVNGDANLAEDICQTVFIESQSTSIACMKRRKPSPVTL